jgi:beta-lactam-binding protein with PASTA domain
MKNNKNFRISVLKGLILGLVLNCVVIGAFFAINHLLYERIPSFEGRNYYEDIENNVKYKHLAFNVVEVRSSEQPHGTVVSQIPAKHESISRVGNTVLLTVAVATKNVVVPDVCGMSCDVAQRYLDNSNLNVQVVPKTSMTEAFGVVIAMQPAAGSEVEEGSVVCLYYASDDNLVEVPNIIGYNTEVAKGLLESVGLHLNTEYKYVDSSKRRGLVVSQSVDKGQKVPVGFYISIEISSGKAAIATTDITIHLPDNVLNKVQPVQIYLNNDLFYSNNLLLDGSDYSFRATGRGTRDVLTFLINGQKYYTCEINFTKKPVTISNSKYQTWIFGEKETEETSATNTSEVPTTVIQTETLPADTTISNVESVTIIEKTTSFFDIFF